MTKYQLELFNDLVVTKSFSKTARHFNTAYQNVIYQISKLEEEFESTFFIRSKAVTELNYVGEEFAKYSTELIKQYDEIKLRIKLITNRIILGIDIISFDPILSQYFTIYDDNEIDTHPMIRNKLFDALNSGEISCFLGITANITENNNNFESIIEDQLCLVVSDKHDLYKCNSLSIEDIKGNVIDLSKIPDIITEDNLKLLKENNEIKTDIIPSAHGHLLKLGNTVAIIPFLYRNFYPNTFKFIKIDDLRIKHGLYYKYKSAKFIQFSDRLRECAFQVLNEMLTI